MSLMRAARFHQNGPPSVLTVDQIPIPEPGPGQVRVRVRAAALNHLDLWVRRGLPIDTTMPHVGGSDLAGEVDVTGPGVEPWTAGQRVVVDPVLNWDWYERASTGQDPRERPLQLIGEHTDGGFAEYAVVPAANLMLVPDNLSLEVAAAAALNFVTAWHALTTRGALHAGERLLVTGGSGGVATAAVQLGAYLGAEVVAVTSGGRNVERLRALGAHHAVNRTEGDWVANVRTALGGRGANLVIDSVGEAMWPRDCPVARSDGTSGLLWGDHGPSIRNGPSSPVLEATDHHGQHHGVTCRVPRGDGVGVFGSGRACD